MTPRNLDLTTAAAALHFISPEERETWWRMGMSLKSEFGEDGFSIWDDWSQGGSSYNQNDAKDTWKSIKASGGITIATLIDAALKDGFRFNSEYKEPTPEELAARKAKRDADNAKAKADKENRHAEAAKKARGIFGNAKVPTLDHPYIKRKRIKTLNNIRLGDWDCYIDKQRHLIENALIIPIHDKNNNIVSLQAIFPDSNNPLGRDKDFLAGGKKSGGFHLIGEPDKTSQAIVICEGYATGATIHECTGYPVYIAFDAGNLANVAKVVREQLPDSKLIIAADNDQYIKDGKENNTGVIKARAAAGDIRAKLVIPFFDNVTTKPTDFNDLFILEGKEEVTAQINQKNTIKSMENKSGFDINSVDIYSPLPYANSRGKPDYSIENLEEILKRCNITIEKNIIKKVIDIDIPYENGNENGDYDENAKISRIDSICSNFKYNAPIGKITGYLNNIANRNPYNPVVNWIQSKTWDGISRIDEFLETVESGEDTAHFLIRRWMLSAIAAAFEHKGISAQGVLVFQGAQGLGKTSWFKSLVPAHLDVTKDGLSIQPNDKDSVKRAISYWMVELGELDATFRKSDIAALKAFITNDSDEMRLPYAAGFTKYHRRTVFFASVNPERFLHDTTGNRRFWVIPATKINYQHGLDMQQIWAEFYELYKAGGIKGQWWLTKDEEAILNEMNQEHQEIDPIQELISSKFAWESPPSRWRWLTTVDIMRDIGYERPPSKQDVTRANKIILELNGGKRKKNNSTITVLIPEKRYN